MVKSRKKRWKEWNKNIRPVRAHSRCLPVPFYLPLCFNSILRLKKNCWIPFSNMDQSTWKPIFALLFSGVAQNEWCIKKKCSKLKHFLEIWCIVFIGFGQGRVGKRLFKQQNNKNLCYCWHRERVVQTSSFWREGGWTGVDTTFLSLLFFCFVFQRCGLMCQ